MQYKQPLERCICPKYFVKKKPKKHAHLHFILHVLVYVGDVKFQKEKQTNKKIQ